MHTLTSRTLIMTGQERREAGTCECCERTPARYVVTFLTDGARFSVCFGCASACRQAKSLEVAAR